MKNYLFVCSQNRLRSPTAEQIFSTRDDIEVSSAGTNNDAENPLDLEQIEWADVVVAMENTHKTKLQKRFRSELKNKRVIVLGIPDDFKFMDPDLVRLLKSKMQAHIPA